MPESPPLATAAPQRLPTSSRLRKSFLLPILLLAALLALAQINQHLILASDNASYVVLAQALATGRGYVMINEPAAPAMNLYPPGYPLLLAGALQLSGAVAKPMQAIIAMKLVTVIFYLACLPILYVLVQRRRGEATAALTTLLFAVNPPTLSLATEVLSEMPFVAFTLLTLLLMDCFDAAQRAARSARLLIAVALALAAAYYMRTAGMAILAAVPLYLVLKRRIGAGVALGAALVLAALPWFLRSSAPPTPETPFFARSYVHQVLALAPYSDQSATLLDLAGRVVANSLAYGARILPETMFPHLAWLGPLAPVASAIIALLVLLGFLIEIRSGLRASELAIAAYWLSLSLFVWVLGFRYVLVILPFAFLYLLVAVCWVGRAPARFLSFAARRPVSAHTTILPLVLLVAAVLLLSALAVDVRRAERNLRLTRRQTLVEVYAGNLEWTRYLQAASWIAENTPANAVLMSRKPDLLYLLAERQTVEYPYTQDGAILMSTIEHNAVSFILEDAFTWTRTTETYLIPAMHASAGDFALAYETPAPHTRVWKIR